MSFRSFMTHHNWQSGKETAAEQSERLSELRRRVNGLFDDFFRSFETECEPAPSSSSSLFSHGVRPHVDVSETEDTIEVEVELPGMTEKDIEVSVVDDVLRLRGVKRPKDNNGRRTYYLRERAFGAFYREIKLWTDVDADAAEAVLENGVLSVRLPKQKKASRTKVVAVRGE